MESMLFGICVFLGFTSVALMLGVALRHQIASALPVVRDNLDRFRKIPPLPKALLLMFISGFVVYGSTKTNLVDQASGTNDVGMVEGGSTNTPPMMLMMPMPFADDTFSTITPEDIARGWQLWEVRTNHNVCYTMPVEATLCSNWWVRGAFEDVSRVDLGGWRFPFGSNDYSSTWAFSWGKGRFALANTNTEIVAIGAPMSAVPYHSRLWSAVTTNDSRLITWENVYLNRDTNTPVNAQIELRTTGDFIVRSNEVETVYHRVDDFDWDGDGIPNWSDWDPYWYDGDYTGQEDWWREYVDECVGTGLENGYYRLTANFPQADFHRTVLTVGYDEIVVAEPGEYVFLLEKGEDYEFDIEPFSPDVSFEVVDDIPLLSSLMRSYWDWGWWSDWTIDGGSLTFTVPSFNRPGYCCWMPTFQATPPMSHLGPGDSPQTFTAVLTDYAYSQAVEYYWYSDDWNVDFSDPYSEETEIDVYEMPRWRSSSVTVTATFGNHELESTCAFTYGEHESPRVSLELSAPGALLLNSNSVDSAKIGQVDISFVPDVETNGTLRLYCASGAERVRLIGSCTRPVTGEESFSIDIEGVATSENLDDVTLCALFTPNGGGGSVSEQTTLTVIQINDVRLPGAPVDGLVISTGTSVALDLDVLPVGAEELLSVIYKVRRLRGNGSYTDWEYAAGNYGGTAAIYNPFDGGIYQVQALAGPGWGADDERYYVWNENEDRSIGRKKKGDIKAFGVCNESWQVSLRNGAKSHLGSPLYAFDAGVAPYGGFSYVPEGCWKCNIFVAHRLADCGFAVPSVHHGRFNTRDWPPLANEWANSTFQIQGWHVISEYDLPQPGYVTIRPSSGPNGHMGILDFDGMAISAQADLVTRRSDVPNWGAAVYRKYTEE